LAHQKKPAQLLVAFEPTSPVNTGISVNPSSAATPTASAYFAALVTTLQGTLTRNETSLNDGDVLPATLYLIAIVIPFAPPALLRSQSSTLLVPLLPHTYPHASSLRSFVTIFGIFISSLDSHSLDAPALRNVFSTIVEHTIDPRHKVRRKAAEAVRDILSNPPPPLQAHPWRVRVGEWACAVLRTQTAKPDTLIHLLASLKMLVPQCIARERLKTFATHLLFLPKLSHPYLSQAAYDLLTSLLSSESDDIDPDEARETASSVLEAIAANPPSKQNTQLTAYWLSALGQASLGATSTTPPLPSGIELDTHSHLAATQIDSGIWHSHTSNRPQKFVKAQRNPSSNSPNASRSFSRPHPHPCCQPSKAPHTPRVRPALGNVLRTLEGPIMVFAAPWSDAVRKSSAQEYFGDAREEGVSVSRRRRCCFLCICMSGGGRRTVESIAFELGPRREVSCQICVG